MEKSRINKVNLYWHNYKYFPYEKELAIREVRSMLKPTSIKEENGNLELLGEFEITKLEKLVYFSKFKIEEIDYYTNQYLVENGTSSQVKRQYTRYSVHGLHEYKGKFNPQIVSALLNCYNIDNTHRVLDPFCGSGTTLVECARRGVYAIGTDINPLAVRIADAKMRSLHIKNTVLWKDAKRILESFKERLLEPGFEEIHQDERIEYLLKWFNKDLLYKLEILKEIIENSTIETKEIFLILVSDILRDYSNQEPSDLRIRRRKSPLPEIVIEDRVESSLFNFIESVETFQNAVGLINTDNIALNIDIRDLSNRHKMYNNYFDFAITSPPYATALPYIDTQRLSLVWLNLIKPSEIKPLDAYLIGSREFNKKNYQQEWVKRLESNESNLPERVLAECIEIDKSINEMDGFRKKAVPSLLYRYFSEMKMAFSSVSNSLTSNGSFIMIVGHNRTSVGGKERIIDTPKHLVDIGYQTNFECEEIIELQTYQRYGLHASNAVNTESLIVLRKK